MSVCENGEDVPPGEAKVILITPLGKFLEASLDELPLINVLQGRMSTSWSSPSCGNTQ